MQPPDIVIEIAIETSASPVKLLLRECFSLSLGGAPFGFTRRRCSRLGPCCLESGSNTMWAFRMKRK
jgi:hypothetical protein